MAMQRPFSMSEVLEMNRKMKEERERVIRNQGPITPELVYSQFQRNDGRWPHKRDMTTEEMEAHQKMMAPIWDKVSKMTVAQYRQWKRAESDKPLE
jgi:hypothetical protein